MGKSDEITEKIMAGESSEDLILKGYDKRSVKREVNKIERILKLHKGADLKAEDNINIRKILVIVQHGVLELSWGTLLAIWGIAGTFRALWLADKQQISYNNIATFLAIAGPLYFLLSNVQLIRALREFEPSKPKTAVWRRFWLQLLAVTGFILIVNGVAGVLNIQFLQLLLKYRIGSWLLPAITVFGGILLFSIYLIVYSKQKRAGSKAVTHFETG